MNKITAVGLITLFAEVTAAPLIHLDECNMPCCAGLATCCCDMDQEVACPTISDCGSSIFVLIGSGPFHKSELKSSDSISRRFITDLDIFKIETNYVTSFGKYDPGPITFLNLPLLI